MGNLISSEECPEVAAVVASDPVYKACENTGEYYNGTSCVSFPTAPEATFDLQKLLLNNEDYSSLKGNLGACGPDISYFDNSQIEGSKCGTCGDNEIFNGSDCACDDGFKRSGDNCIRDCSEVGQMQSATDSNACECQPGYENFPIPGKDLNCLLPQEGFSNRESAVRGRNPVNEKMIMLLLVLVLLCIYRRQVQIFLKKTVKIK